MSLSMRTKLMGTLVFSVIATIVVGWLGIAGIHDINSVLNGFYTNDFVPARVVAEANFAITAWSRDILNYLIAQDEQAKDEYRRIIAEEENITLGRIQALSAMQDLTPEEKLLISKIAGHFQQIRTLWDRILTQSTVQRETETPEVLLRELQPGILQVSREMNDFLQLQEQQSVAAKTAADQRYHKDLKRISLLIGFIALILLFVDLFMAGGFIRSIGQLVQGIGELGKGNFDYRVKVRAKDELSRLASVFNTMAAEVKRSRGALQKSHYELEMRVEERTMELGKINEELRKEVAERMRIEDALRKSSEELKFFAYSVMHDLKSPAVGVHGIANLLHRHYAECLNERGKTYCDQILRTSRHIAAFVDTINVFITTKENPLVIEEIEVKEILKTLREEFDNDLCLRQVEWREPDSSPIEIRADRLSMIRVFRNLINNALKYGGENLAEICIGYKQSRDFHIFSVSDDGVGIKKEDCERIFEVFERNTKSQQIEGTGLGLAIVREIAERHGGKVWAEPSEQRGTTFYVSVSKGL